MKRILSILFASLILVSGMHLTIATHFCGGVYAATKASFSGELASCGMEQSDKSTPFSSNHFDTKCCDDEVINYSVDNNFAPSNSIVLELIKNISHVYYLPVDISCKSLSTNNSFLANVFPPGNFITNAVSIVDICVFRI
ncbi:MAG: hypothetical protein HOO91_00790 [Bacteroidales bacterium]|nr:hypothetical protein [Bacteroidales bacterium]